MPDENLDTTDPQNLLPEATPEQPPETPAEPSAETPVEEAAKAPETRPETVPLATLLEERNRFKRDIQDLNQTWNERLNTVMNEVEQLKNPQKGPPDPEEDLVGFLTHRDATRQREVDDLQQQMQQYHQQNEQQMQLRQLDEAFAQSAQTFEKQNPDFRDAHMFLLEARKNELAELGFEPQQINQIMEQNMIATTMQALKSGRDIADVVYKIARQRGYAGPQTQTPEPSPMTQTRGTPPVDETVQRMRAGHQQATGLGPTTTRARAPGMSMQQLADQPQDWWMENMDMNSFMKAMRDGVYNNGR